VPAVPTHTALRRNNPMRQRPIPEICIRQEIGFVFSPSQSAAAGIPRGPGSGVGGNTLVACSVGAAHAVARMLANLQQCKSGKAAVGS
jgi:hypothetical protein